MSGAGGPPLHDRARQSGFDKLARVYCWLEYASFGPLLQRTRLQFLPHLAGARRVLVLGDGDGRFCVALLRAVPDAQVVAVDASGAMLRRLHRRAQAAGVADRLTTVHGGALEMLPSERFDLVCMHFFLDCFPDGEVARLVSPLRQSSPSATWVVSDFGVPTGPMRWPAWVVVRLLYRGFRVLTGLEVQRLPDYAATFHNEGLVLRQVALRLGGMLRSELWGSTDMAE